jgi:hypothetical protein
VARHIELTWVCSSCSLRNKGRYTTCQQCGHPKDESEQYEMPADPSQAATVTDEALLRMAIAGPNWKCAYCGSDERKLDGACKQCGAPSPQLEGELAPPIANEPAAPILTPWREMFHWGPQQKVAAAIAAVAVTGGGVYLYENRERDYSAKVEVVHWTQSITVERYAQWTRDGWRESQPEGAFDVVSTPRARPCVTRAARTSRNGFASCNTVCSGGGRSCTPKWCTEMRTRQVPVTHQEPRYQEAIQFKIWDWGDQRTVDATGTDPAAMRWPVEEAKIGQGLGEREKERERRSAQYRVTLDYDDQKLKFDVTLADLPKFQLGSMHDVKIKDEHVVVDGKPVDRKY